MGCDLGRMALLAIGFAGALGSGIGAEDSYPFPYDTRVPWRTSRVLGTPEPPLPYVLERVSPELKFKDPVDVCSAPGLDRLFVLELRGRIHSFRAGEAKADLFFDLTNAVPEARNAYGMTFHPGFATNREIYVCYTLKDDLPDGTRVSRFKVSREEPFRVDPGSEEILITWVSGGHNGGCLKFGLDGYLYISTGDAAGPNPPDPLKTGQDNTDLLSSVLRIDVDRKDPGKAYRVPPDNPFVGVPDCRPEIWAYGFRNPWRMGIDRMTGELWVGDVGWELWELVFRVERGGNYGWSIVEGPQSIHPGMRSGPTKILPPIKIHPHSEAASVTGGHVYRGKRLPGLVGAYVYGDWVTGKIWGLRMPPSGGEPEVRELVDSPYQIIAFGEDNAGEVYVLEYAGGLHRLQPNPATGQVSQFPRTLSATGLFASVKEHQLAGGVLPFSVNAEMWADGAQAERFIGLPGTSFVEVGATNVWLYQRKKEWRFPTNAVLGKTLSMELQPGERGSRKRIETQLLHFDGLDWRAYSYRWNEAGDDAELVGANGAEATLELKGANGGGGKRTWRFHSRTECLRCHNSWDNYALAFTDMQLNRLIEASGGGRAAAGRTERKEFNQLRALGNVQAFNLRPEPDDVRLVNPYHESGGRGDLEKRARSWLHVNCGHCHREGAGGAVVTHFDFDTKREEMKAIGRPPSQGNFGLTNAQVIAAGDPYRSVAYYRILTLGSGRMPLIGSREVDEAGAKLIHEWIIELGLRERSDAIRKQLKTPRGTLELVSTLPQGVALPDDLVREIAAAPEAHVRDLMERYLPEELRKERLGASFPASAVLSRKGDAVRGKKVFLEGAQCGQCHRAAGEGRDVGPDLSAIGKKFGRADLLEHILQPSKVIEPAHVSYAIETVDGESYTGFVVKRTEKEIVLKDATGNEVVVALTRIKSNVPQALSMMPEGLLQSLSAEEAADLLEFLGGMK